MMVHWKVCSVLNCKHNLKGKKPNGVRMFVYPHVDQELFNKWKRLTGRPDIRPEQEASICYLHFLPEELHTKQCWTLQSYKTCKCLCKLREGCYPTLLLPPGSERDLNRLKRRQKRENRIIVEQLLQQKPSIGEPIKVLIANQRKPLVEHQPAKSNKNRCTDERAVLYELSDRPAKSPELFVEMESEEELEIFSESEPDSEMVIDVDVSDVELPCLQDLCRVCTQSASQYVTIFSDEGRQLQLKHKINACLPITIEEKDKLPLQICRDCIPRLEVSYELSTLCQKSDFILKAMLHEEQEFEEPSCVAMQCEEAYSAETEVRQAIGSASSVPPVLTCTVPPSASTTKTPSVVNIPSSPKSRSTSSRQTPKSSSHKTLALFICSLCYKAFYTEFDRINHMKEGHLFMCLNCNVKVKGMDSSVLDDHMKICQNAKVLNATENTVSMPVTENQADSEPVKQVETQKSEHKNEDPIDEKPSVKFEVRCNKCYIHFVSYAELNKHECVPGVECLVCDVYCESIHIYKQHLKVIHSVFPCKSRQLCLQYFETEGEANLHYKNNHRKKQRKICQICGKSFSKLPLLREHIEYIHEKRENKYKCNLCDKTYRYYPKLNQHILQTHEGKNIFKCPNCTLRFATLLEMKQHVHQVHTEKLHTCNDCQATFVYKHELQSHVEKTHVHEYIYQCRSCDFCSKILSTIKVHVKTHTSSGNPKYTIVSNFQCKICLTYYKTPKDLYHHHKNVHKLSTIQYRDLNDKELKTLQQKYGSKHVTSRGEWKCPVCSKICQSHLGYMHHKAIHSKVLKFQCKKCKKPFPTLSQVKSHERMHTLNKK